MPTMKEIEGKIRSFGTISEVVSFLRGLVSIDNPSDPEKYKASTSEYGSRTANVKKREEINAKCKEILARVSDPDELTPEDRDVLLQYSGRGGTDDNSQFEYYTPAPIAAGVWDLMRENGFENGNVLDPACGAGIFEGMKPDNGVVVTGIDIDPTSSGVAQLLNPTDQIDTQSFEKLVMSTEDGIYDSAIGNVPFGKRDQSRFDDEEYKNEKSLERYFLLRAIDKVRPGGLICFICPTNIVGNKGKQWEEFRTRVSMKAEFLGAHKLPSGVFHNQGTETVTDIVVLRKHSKDFLDTIDQYPLATLKESNVIWAEFIRGKYWQGEGKRFIHGDYVPKGPGRFDRETVSAWDKNGDGKVDNEALRRRLAVKFHSRIKWDILNQAETITRNYSDGDCRFINGAMRTFRSGEWVQDVTDTQPVALDPKLYGFNTRQEIVGALEGPLGLLAFSRDQLQNIVAAGMVPTDMWKKSMTALSLAEKMGDESQKEQLYRGVLIGERIEMLAEKQRQGEDVAEEIEAMKTLVAKEIDKYGNPRNNPAFSKIHGAGTREFYKFRSAVDADGNFTGVLAGEMDVEGGHAFDPTNIHDILNYQLSAYERDDITLDDLKRLYKGSRKLESLSDIADLEDVAISPDGHIMPMHHYCAGNGYQKIAECVRAYDATDDVTLKAKYQKQIENLRSKMHYSKINDVQFTLRAKWFSPKYIEEFLELNGYEDIKFRIPIYGKPDKDGNPTIVGYEPRMTQDGLSRDGDWDNPKGVFALPEGAKKPSGFKLQLIKYLNGANISGNDKDAINSNRSECEDLEAQFTEFIRSHEDAQEIERTYNVKFNSYIQEEFDTGTLGIEDMLSGEITPHGYQNQEVRRLTANGAGICGFGVGLGKSFTAMALIANNLKKGHFKRTCLVVPDAVLENWYHESHEFYSPDFLAAHVRFIGMEPVKDKDGNIQTIPVLDEYGEPKKTRRDGSPKLHHVVRKIKDAGTIARQLWDVVDDPACSVVVMTKDRFATISLEEEHRNAYMVEMTARNLIRRAEEKEAKGKKKGKSYDDDKAAAGLRAQFGDEGRKKDRTNVPTLEELGIDNIITDESHFFKNNMQGGKASANIHFVPSAPVSQIGQDMAMKSHYIRSLNQGRGVYGLSATPVTNSPVEIFNMLSLVMPLEEWDKRNILTVDDFINTFAAHKQKNVMLPRGEMQEMDALDGFQNLDGLRNLFHKYVNVKNAKDVDGEIHVPTQVDVEEEVDITSEQYGLYKILRRRACALSGLDYTDPDTGITESTERDETDSIFSIMRDMDRVTTDVDMYYHVMTFVLPEKYHEECGHVLSDLAGKSITIKDTVATPDGEGTEEVDVVVEANPKILRTEGEPTFKFVVEEHFEDDVLESFAKHGIKVDETAHPVTPKYAKLMANLTKEYSVNGKQIIFTEEKSQHGKLKRIIVHHLPVTGEQIGIINAEEADGEKLGQISDAYNSGAVKIIIANRKAEVGVNLQKGTTAIHHLTLPWTPSSINQRNGRGVRQGNKIDSVHVYYYYGKGTFDGYRKQLLEVKANWIDSILNGQSQTAEVMDMSSGDMLLAFQLTPEEAARRKAEQEAAAKRKAEQLERKRQMSAISLYVAGMNDLKWAKEEADNRRLSLQREISELRYEVENPPIWLSRKDVERKKKQLAKYEKELAELDPAKVAEKVRIAQSKVNRAKSVIEAARKKGSLIVDEDLLNTPEKLFITKDQQVVFVGQQYETVDDHNNPWILEVVTIDRQDMTVSFRKIVGGAGWYGLVKNGKKFNYDRRPTKIANFGNYGLKPCSYSSTEIRVKQLIAEGLEYEQLSTVEAEKSLILENGSLIPIRESYRGVAIVKDGDGFRFVTPRELHVSDVVWPEKDNADFRTACLKAYLEKKYDDYSERNAADMMRALFGNDWRSRLNEVNNLTDEKRTELVQKTLDQVLQEVCKSVGIEKIEENPLTARYKLNLMYVETYLRDVMNDNGFEPDELSRSMLRNEKDKILERLDGQIKADAEKQQKANPNFKEVSLDWRQKFTAIGVRVGYNNVPLDTFYIGKAEPWSKILIGDIDFPGPTYRNKSALKINFGAKFLSKGEWSEKPNEKWWCIDSRFTLQELYDLLSK